MQGAPKGPNLKLLHPGLKCGDSTGACPRDPPIDPRMFSKRFLLRPKALRGAGPTDYKPWGHEAQTQNNTNQSKLKAKCQTHCKLKLQIFVFQKQRFFAEKHPFFSFGARCARVFFLKNFNFSKTPNCFTNFRLVFQRAGPFFENFSKFILPEVV